MDNITSRKIKFITELKALIESLEPDVRADLEIDTWNEWHQLFMERMLKDDVGWVFGQEFMETLCRTREYRNMEIKAKMFGLHLEIGSWKNAFVTCPNIAHCLLKKS